MDLTPLAELLSAPSKQAVDDFLCACAQEREEPAAPTAARVAELTLLFGLTEQRAIALQRAGAALIGEVIYSAATVEQIGARFPDDFQPQLKGLILRVFEHRMDDWRCAAAARRESPAVAAHTGALGFHSQPRASHTSCDPRATARRACAPAASRRCRG